MAIFYDQYGREMKTEDFQERLTINMQPEEEVFEKKFIGEVEDTVTFLVDGKHEVMPGIFINAEAGESVTLPVAYNLVVDSFSKLIAVMLKRDAVYATDAIFKVYWECGSGNSSWNDVSPPSPVAGDTTLLTPTFRKLIVPATDMSYLDASNNVLPGGQISNRVQIKTTFGSTEANGYLREFGIFAGNATATLGSGIMVNRKTHGVIYKTTGMDLQRSIRFTL